MCKREFKEQEEAHLPELKGGNYHKDDASEAQVQPVPMGQTGVRLPLQQLEHRVDDYHGSPWRSITAACTQNK